MYKIIEELCIKKGITLNQLSKQVGISSSTFTELKSGRTHELSANNALKVAKFFNVSFEYLKGEDQETKKPLPENEERLKELYELTADLTEDEVNILRAFAAGLKANRKND